MSSSMSGLIFANCRRCGRRIVTSEYEANAVVQRLRVRRGVVCRACTTPQEIEEILQAVQQAQQGGRHDHQ